MTAMAESGIQRIERLSKQLGMPLGEGWQQRIGQFAPQRQESGIERLNRLSQQLTGEPLKIDPGAIDFNRTGYMLPEQPEPTIGEMGGAKEVAAPLLKMLTNEEYKKQANRIRGLFAEGKDDEARGVLEELRVKKGIDPSDLMGEVEQIEQEELRKRRNLAENMPENRVLRSALFGPAQGGADLFGAAARAMGLDENARFFENAANRMEAAIQQKNQKEGVDPLRVGDTDIDFYKALRGALRTVPNMVAAAQVGGPYASIALASGTRGSQAIGEAERVDLEDADKWKYAGRAAAIEGLIAAAFQYVGLGGAESRAAAGSVFSGGLKETMRRLGISTLQELPEEIITEVSDNLNQYFSGVASGEETISKKALKQTVADTTLKTLLTMGLLETSSQAMGRANPEERAKNIASSADMITDRGDIDAARRFAVTESVSRKALAEAAGVDRSKLPRLTAKDRGLVQELVAARLRLKELPQVKMEAQEDAERIGAQAEEAGAQEGLQEEADKQVRLRDIAETGVEAEAETEVQLRPVREIMADEGLNDDQKNEMARQSILEKARTAGIENIPELGNVEGVTEENFGQMRAERMTALEKEIAATESMLYGEGAYQVRSVEDAKRRAEETAYRAGRGVRPADFYEGAIEGATEQPVQDILAAERTAGYPGETEEGGIQPNLQRSLEGAALARILNESELPQGVSVESKQGRLYIASKGQNLSEINIVEEIPKPQNVDIVVDDISATAEIAESYPVFLDGRERQWLDLNPEEKRRVAADTPLRGSFDRQTRQTTLTRDAAAIEPAALAEEVFHLGVLNLESIDPELHQKMMGHFDGNEERARAYYLSGKKSPYKSVNEAFDKLRSGEVYQKLPNETDQDFQERMDDADFDSNSLYSAGQEYIPTNPQLRGMADKVLALRGEAKKGASVARQADTLLRKELIDYAKKNLPLKEQGRLLRHVRDLRVLFPSRQGDDALRRLNASIQYVDKLFQRWNQKEHVQNFDKVYKNTTKKFGKDFEKMRPEFRDSMRELFNAADPTPMGERKRRKLTNTKEFLQENPDLKAEMPDYILEGLNRLEQKNVRQMDTDELSALTNAMKQLVKMNDLKNTLISRGRAREAAAVKRDIVGRVGAPKKNEAGEIDIPRGTWRTISDNVENIESLAIMLDGDDSGPMQQYISDNLDAATDEFIRLQDSFSNQFKELLTRNNVALGSDFDAWSSSLPGKTEMVVTELPSGMKLRLSRSRRVALAMTAMDPDGYKALTKGKNGFVTKHYKVGRSRGNETDVQYQNMSEEDVDSFLQSLSPEEQSLARSVREFLDVLAGTVNEASVDLKGYEIATRENYFPLYRDVRSSKEADINNVIQQHDPILGWSALKERMAKSNARVVIPDIFDVIGQHYKHTAALKGFGMPLKTIDNILASESIGDAVNAKYGKGTLRRLREMIDRVRGASTKQYRIDLEKWYSRVRSNAVGATVSMNPPTWAAQTLSYPLAGMYLPPQNVALYARPLIPSEARVADAIASMDYAPQLAARIKHGFIGRDVGEWLAHNELYNMVTGETLLSEKILSSPMRFFDSLAIRSVIMASHRTVMQETGSKDPMAPNVLRRAGELANKVVRRTQPTWDQKDRTLLSGTKNEFLKTITVFRSFRDKVILMNKIALRTGGVKGLTKSLAFTAMFGAVANMLRRAAVDWWRGREDKDKRIDDYMIQFGKEMASYIPFASDIENTVEAVIKGRMPMNDVFSSPVTDAFSDAILSLGYGIKAGKEYVGDERYKRGKQRGKLKWKKSSEKSFKKFLSALRLRGIPAESIWRDATGNRFVKEKKK